MWYRLTSFSNLCDAYKKAARRRRYKGDALRFGMNLENEILLLQKELRSGTYIPGDYRSFIRHDSKRRIIQVAPFRDRVVHHALCNCIAPLFESHFIHDSYACRKNRGTHKAIQRVERLTQSVSKNFFEPVYYMHCDVRKYFDSINHIVLFSQIMKRVYDLRTLQLIWKIIKSNGLTVGIPIGNLTSQLFANIYLNELDYTTQFLIGAKQYVRYMDDVILIESEKKKLWNIYIQMKYMCEKELCVSFKESSPRIIPCEKGIDFLGYISFRTYRLLRKSTVRRMFKKARKKQYAYKKGFVSEYSFKNAMASFDGYIKHANAWKIRNELKKIDI
ncbi:RNA-dependent DNA polymerase [Candidatus Parcubacteria bacterium]|nr:MAG: RNA-dependent DNA polymerase [Candidatus Parcubacteria bacterium]